MSNIDQLIQIAKAEIGVKESPANSDNVKYNTAYYGKTVKSTASTKYYWCVVFIWWLFQQAGLPGLFYGGGKTASCGSVKNYAQKNGLWVTSGYRKGDLLLFNFSGGTAPSHIGLCVEASGSKVTSIDGNTSAGDAGSQDNGGMVNIRARSVSTVVGAYRPDYDGKASESTKVSTVSVKAPVLKKGIEHDGVKVLQAFLNASGFSCGGVDGSFGPATDTAFRAFQKAVGLTVDGSCGAKSWAKILGV